MQIHVVDSFFGFVKVRFVTIFVMMMMMNHGRVRARVRARTMRRCGGAARRCSYRWSWP